MKKLLLKSILILIFIAIISFLACIFTAGVYFKKAKNLNKQYLWTKAETAHKKIIALNPYNADYFSGYGNFILKQSEYRKGEERICWLKKAKELYERACRLNPHYAKYSYSLGDINLRLDKKDHAVLHFQATIAKDPYNLLNNYLVGNDLVRVWDSLSSEDREFATARFKYILSERLRYNKLVFPLLYNKTKDFKILQKITPDDFKSQKRLYDFIVNSNLWQYRKEQKKILESYANKENINEFQEMLDKKEGLIKEIKEKFQDNKNTIIERKDWQGLSYSGSNAYENGNMYWTGTINASIYMTLEDRKLKVQLKGESAEEIWPYMIIEVDGEVVGETFVDNHEWKEHDFAIKPSKSGLKIISITFANDGGDQEIGEDRNLYIGEIEVGKNNEFE